jgi:hypothetical protein
VTRFHLAFAAFVTLSLAAPGSTFAQAGRAAGIVRDTNGRPIRSAIVRAVNPVAHPSEITSTTDTKGRWAMIGLASGEWRFTVEAPGFAPAQAAIRSGWRADRRSHSRWRASWVRCLARSTRTFNRRSPTRRRCAIKGRFDQAIAAYEDIRSKNPKLTSVYLVLGDVYRQKAAQQSDAASRQTLLNQAVSSYTEMLKSDAENEHAKAGLDSIRAELATLSGVTQ